MTELYRHIGEHTDVPAGDIGVGRREIGYLFGQYKRITNRYESGVITGKGLGYGGAQVRTEATGYGCAFFADEMLRARGDLVRRASGSWSPGRATSRSTRSRRSQQLGGIVVACSDSSGYVLDEKGIDLDLLKQIKQVERGRIGRVRRTARRRHRLRTRRAASGRCRATWPCRAPRRTRSPAATPQSLVRSGLRRGRRGRQHAHHPEAASGCSGRRACRSRRARPPTPAAWPPARWRCSRTPPATPGPSSTPRSRLSEIMRDIHGRCLADRRRVRHAGRLRGRRQHRRLPASRRRDARPRPHLTAGAVTAEGITVGP